jgi:hypothetical protein
MLKLIIPGDTTLQLRYLILDSIGRWRVMERCSKVLDRA